MPNRDRRTRFVERAPGDAALGCCSAPCARAAVRAGASSNGRCKTRRRTPRRCGAATRDNKTMTDQTRTLRSSALSLRAFRSCSNRSVLHRRRRHDPRVVVLPVAIEPSRQAADGERRARERSRGRSTDGATAATAVRARPRWVLRWRRPAVLARLRRLCRSASSSPYMVGAVRFFQLLLCAICACSAESRKFAAAYGRVLHVDLSVP